MAKIISYWASNHGIGTTANCIAISSYISINYQLKTLLAHSQYIKSNMESAFLSEDKNSNFLNFTDVGLDSLERLAKTGQLSTLINFDEYTNELLEGRLYLLPGSRRINQELFNEKTKNTILTILSSAKKYYGLINIDLNSGLYNKVTKEVLKDSDIVIIGITQNEKLLNDLFNTKTEWPKVLDNKKKVYVISRYDPLSKYSPKYITSNFGIDAPLFCIPYLTKFNDYCNSHKALDYFYNLENDGSKEVEIFIDQIAALSEYILDETGFNVHELYSPIEKSNFVSEIVNSLIKRVK